MEDLEAYS